MRNYWKQQAWFNICDFFKECKAVILIAFIIICMGFAFACATIDGRFIDEIILRSTGKVVLRTLFTLTVCYCLIFFSAYNKYTLVLGVLSFLFFGYRCGISACYLATIAGISGIISLIFIYIPLFLVSFSLLTVAMSISLGYQGFDRCGHSRFANTCVNIRTTLLKKISLVYVVNVLFSVLFLWIFGNIFNVVCIVV